MKDLLLKGQSHEILNTLKLGTLVKETVSRDFKGIGSQEFNFMKRIILYCFSLHGSFFKEISHTKTGNYFKSNQTCLKETYFLALFWAFLEALSFEGPALIPRASFASGP